MQNFLLQTSSPRTGLTKMCWDISSCPVIVLSCPYVCTLFHFLTSPIKIRRGRPQLHLPSILPSKTNTDKIIARFALSKLALVMCSGILGSCIQSKVSLLHPKSNTSLRLSDHSPFGISISQDIPMISIIELLLAQWVSRNSGYCIYCIVAVRTI